MDYDQTYRKLTGGSMELISEVKVNRSPFKSPDENARELIISISSVDTIEAKLTIAIEAINALITERGSN